MAVDSLIIGSSVDLIAEGLVDPESVRFSSSARGFESCDFTVDAEPHVTAHNALVADASVTAYAAGATVFEGTVLSINDAGSPHVVECGGTFEQMKRRQDFAYAIAETRFDRFIDITDAMLSPASRLTEATVNTTDELLIMCANGSAYGADQMRVVGMPLNDCIASVAYDTGAGLGMLECDIAVSLPADWTAAYAIVDSSTNTDVLFDPGILESPVVSPATAVSADTQLKTSTTSSDYYLAIQFALRAPATGGTLAADAYIQVRNLRIVGNTSSDDSIDAALLRFTNWGGSTYSVSTIGSTIRSLVVDPFTTRAEGIEQLLAQYSAPVLCGFWENSTLKAKARPTSPDDRTRWYVVTDEDFDSPSDWQVLKDTEAELDAVCCSYALVPTNEVALPTPTSATWPDSWARSSTDNCTIANSGSDYWYQIRSNATARNPLAYTPATTTELDVTAGRRYFCRFRGIVSAYPGSGTAYMQVYWYTSGGVYISASTVKSWTAAAATETWYEAMMTAPATAAYAIVRGCWSGVTGGASNYDLRVRDVEFRSVVPEGTPRVVYYPSNPSSMSSRVTVLDIGSATLSEATNAATQCYLWYSDLHHGQARLSGPTIRTIDGAEVPIEHVRAWDWITKADDPGGESLFISRTEYSNGLLTLDIGTDDTYAPPGYQHIKPVGRYVGGFTHRHRELYAKWWRRTHKNKPLPKKHPKWHYGKSHEHEGYYR